MNNWFSRTLLVLIAALIWLSAATADAYTANKVWFEFRPNGIYRVYVNYTVPALREFREAYAEFTSKKEAEAFYWDLVKGVDFFMPNPKARKFVENPQKPSPW